MPAQLISLDEGPSVLLDKPILLIGRHPECDIQIDSRKISRRHCCIAQVADYLVIRDLGSTNGVRVNGDRVLEGRLDEGDEVTIGASRFRVSWDERAVEAPKPARRDEPVNPAEDELLESSDQPIPLAEPDALRPKPHRTVPGQSPKAPGAGDEPPILPDVLELAPSDVFPSLPSHTPHSHPPL